MRATIEYQRGGKVYTWRGVLSRQDGLGVDQATRTVPVRIHVPKPSTTSKQTDDADRIALVRGMFVKVWLHCRPSTPIAIVPETVLRPGKTVWMMKDGQLQMLKINIAAIRDGQAFVDLRNSQLAVGYEIISSPVPNARNGLAVSLMGKTGKGKSGSGDATPKSQGPDSPRKRPKNGNGNRPKAGRQGGPS